MGRRFSTNLSPLLLVHKVLIALCSILFCSTLILLSPTVFLNMFALVNSLGKRELEIQSEGKARLLPPVYSGSLSSWFLYCSPIYCLGRHPPGLVCIPPVGSRDKGVTEIG